MSCNCRAKDNFVKLTKLVDGNHVEFEKKGVLYYFENILNILIALSLRVLTLILIVLIFPFLMVWMILSTIIGKPLLIRVPKKMRWYIKEIARKEKEIV